jgi:nickel/cobalt exporter
MKRITRMSYFLIAAFGMLTPSTAWAHLVNSNVGKFYAGMLHPLTSAEHTLPMLALALLASQCDKKAGRLTILLFPLALFLGILAGSRFPLAGFFHFANLATLAILGGLLISASWLTPMIPASGAIVIGLILGWRSGGDWAASGVGFQFVPGVALTGFIIMAVIAAWIPPASNRIWGILRSLTGSGFLIAGMVMLSHLLLGSDAAVGRSIGLPTEESLKALVTAPKLSSSFVIGAFFAAMVWGATHALTPGHGKAIVGAYLVGARGTAWHALYLGLTVTVTHTLGVFILGLAATLAASHVDPEKLYPWLGVISGLIVFILGAVMLANRIRRFKSIGVGHDHYHGHHHTDDHSHDHSRTHEHPNDHLNADEDHDHSHHHHHEEPHTDAVHNHDHLHHHHDGHGHSHLPPGATGSPVTWRSLLTLGISGGLLPCPSALVRLLAAVSLHRIGFGLTLVTAFSLGLAGVLTVVGLLFIKGSHLINKNPSLSAVGRLLPSMSALIICFLGGSITWSAVSRVMGG